MTKLHPTKQKILETAIDLFSKVGYSAISIRDITQAVGIKESTLYYHFKNKEQLLHHILNIFQQEIRKVLPPVEILDQLLATTPPQLFLLQGLRKFKAYICDDETISKISRIVSIEQFAHPMARSIIIDDLYEQNIKFLEVVFTKYIELEAIHPFPARTLAVEYQYPIFTMITQYQIMRFDGRDTTTLEKEMEEHVSFFLHKIIKE